MPVLQALAPNKERPRIDIAYTDLRKEIFRHGVDVFWEMAAVCPCGRKLSDFATSPTRYETNEPVPSCVKCKGKGYIYHSKQEIKAVVQDASRDPDRWKVFGEHAAGSATFTTLPEHLPSFLDKFTLKDSTILYRERRKRTIDPKESLRYPVVTRTFTLGDTADPTIPVDTTMGVVHAISADVDGVIIDNELVENTDFSITADGKIDWALGMARGTAPAKGAFYSVHYYANPVYIVRTMPFTRRDTTVKTKSVKSRLQELPTKFLVWLEFLGDK